MAPSVWEHLHNLQHIDHSFKKVDNDFVYPDSYEEIFNWNNTNKYQESIQMFIALCAIFGVLFIVLISCFACCCNYVRASEIEEEDEIDNANLLGYQHIQNENQRVSDVTSQLTKWAKYTRWCISSLVLIFIILSFIFSFILNDTIKDVQNTVNNSYHPYETCIEDGDAINVTLTDAIRQCEIIRDEATYNYTRHKVHQIEKELKSTREYIATYLDEGESISWENSGDELNTHRQQLFYVCIALTCFTLVIVLISICTSVKINICNGIVSMLVALGMIVLWIIASIEFGISVEVADICADPNDAVIQAINHTSYTHDYNNTIAIVKYYLYCDNKHSHNPLITYISNAYDDLRDMNNSIAELQASSNGTSYQDNADALAKDYNTSLYEIEALNSSLNCDNIHNYYNRIEDDVCYNLLEEWYALYVFQFLIVGFLVLRLCFTCRNSVNKRVANFVIAKNIGSYREYYDQEEIGADPNTRYEL